MLHGGRGLEPKAHQFFSISTTIDLTSGESDVCEDSEADVAAKPFVSYGAVNLSLAYPKEASPSAAPKAAAPEAAPIAAVPIAAAPIAAAPIAAAPIAAAPIAAAPITAAPETAAPEAAAPETAAPIAAAPKTAAPETAAPETAAPIAAAPIAAAPVVPAEFQHVLLHYSGHPSEEGVCFYRSSKQFALAFKDGTWLGCKLGTPWDACPAEQQQCDIAGSIIAPGKVLLPEGWLYSMSLIEGWHVFDKFAHMPDFIDPRCSATPRLPPLEVGHIVDCVGKVWSGDGNTCASTTTGLEFLGIAQQRDGTQWRRYAVLVLRSGELTWGELLGVTEGLVKRSEPLAQASALTLTLTLTVTVTVTLTLTLTLTLTAGFS